MKRLHTGKTYKWVYNDGTTSRYTVTLDYISIRSSQVFLWFKTNTGEDLLMDGEDFNEGEIIDVIEV